MRRESGEFHQAPQGEFTPATAHLRAAQRGHEVARLALQLRLSEGNGLDLRAQARERVAPLAFQRLHLRLGAFQRHAQRFDELRDRHLALLECPLGDDLVAAERLARQAQEQLAVAAQGLPGEGVERGAQARLGLLEQAHALGILERLGLEAYLRGREFDPQRFDAAAGADVTDERAEYGAGEKGRADHEVDEVREAVHRLKCAR